MESAHFFREACDRASSVDDHADQVSSWTPGVAVTREGSGGETVRGSRPELDQPAAPLMARLLMAEPVTTTLFSLTLQTLWMAPGGALIFSIAVLRSAAMAA